jgi:mycoredoxin
MATYSPRIPYGGRPRRTEIPLTVYGRRWCGISQMVRRHLERAGIPYDYVDLEQHPEIESRLAWVTGGRVHTPVVYVGGEVLVQPTIRELEWALSRSGAR